MMKDRIPTPKRPLIGNQPAEQPVDETGRLAALLTVNDKARLYSEDRKARVSALMKRPSFKKLTPEKQVRMARRLMNASREATATADFCEQLQHRLTQLAGQS